MLDIKNVCQGTKFTLNGHFGFSSLAGIYFLKVDNRNTRTGCEICLKLAINTPELASVWLTLNIFQTLFLRFYC